MLIINLSRDRRREGGREGRWEGGREGETIECVRVFRHR